MHIYELYKKINHYKLNRKVTLCFLCQGTVSERVGARVFGVDGVQPQTRGDLQLQSYCLQRRGTGREFCPLEDYHQT